MIRQTDSQNRKRPLLGALSVPKEVNLAGHSGIREYSPFSTLKVNSFGFWIYTSLPLAVPFRSSCTARLEGEPCKAGVESRKTEPIMGGVVAVKPLIRIMQILSWAYLCSDFGRRPKRLFESLREPFAFFRATFNTFFFTEGVWFSDK